MFALCDLYLEGGSTNLSCGTANQYSCFLPCWAYCCMEALALETKVFLMGFPTRRHKNLWDRVCFFSAQLVPGIRNKDFIKCVYKSLTEIPLNDPKQLHHQWQFDVTINPWWHEIKILCHYFSELFTLFVSTCFFPRIVNNTESDCSLPVVRTKWQHVNVTLQEHIISSGKLTRHSKKNKKTIKKKVHTFAFKMLPSVMIWILTVHSFGICAAWFWSRCCCSCGLC